MRAEVAQLDRAVEEVVRDARDDDLAAVSRGADPGAAVDVEADVALGGDDGLAGMNPHAHAHRASAQSARCASAAASTASRAPRERAEERVALCVDLDAAVCGDGIAYQAPVLRECVRIRLPEALEQPRRALDVGEEQRDRAAEQIRHRSHHGALQRRSPDSTLLSALRGLHGNAS